MHKIFCFIFGVSFASFGMEPRCNASYTAQSEVQEVINDCDNVYRTLKNRQNSDPKFRENNVLLVGGSGTGKDSLLYYFKKTPLKITELGELEASAPLEGVSIGHSCSETIVPASVVVDSITYWSCPGFSDTRGSKQDLVNMFAINNILRGNIKIVIVIDRDSIEIDRHKEIFECVRKIKNSMLPNIANNLSQHLGLIVTRGEYRASQETIQDLLAEINNDNFNRDYNNDVVQIVKDLIEKRIAYFPEPSSGEEMYPSNFRDDILQMIQEIPDYLKLENDTVQIQFDDKAKSFLGDMHIALLAQTNDIIENHLFKCIKILLDNSRNELALFLYVARMSCMGISTHRITSFGDEIKAIRTKMNAVDKNSKGQVLLDSIYNFFMDILHDNSDAVKYLQQIKRISTCIEFVCKYYDTHFFIDKWTTGLQGLNQQLSDCENYIFEISKEATIATVENILLAMATGILSGAVTVGLVFTTFYLMRGCIALCFPDEDSEAMIQDMISCITDKEYREAAIYMMSCITDTEDQEAAIATGANIAPVLLPGTVRLLCGGVCLMTAPMVTAGIATRPCMYTIASMLWSIDGAYTATKLAIGTADIAVERAIKKINDVINPASDTDKNEDN